MDFAIRTNGVDFRDGTPFAWYYIDDLLSGGTRWRVVAFKELAYLPIQERDDPDLLGKQWAAVRGLHNASVDFVYAAMGVYTPHPLGVVQFYGAAAEAGTKDEAFRQATRRLLAVEATLANYPQSRLRAPSTDRILMLFERMEKLPRVFAILGHPDPRMAKRGLGRNGEIGAQDEDLASQQNEQLFRGLAKIREDFVFLVTAKHIDRGTLNRNLIKLAREASHFASRQKGNLGVGFSIALPLAAVIGGSVGGTHSGSHMHSQTHGQGVQQGWGVTHGRSWQHQVSHGHNISDSHTESGMVGGSTTVTHGTGHTDSHAVTNGKAHTVSTAVTDGHSHTTGHTHTESSSTGTSIANGTSQQQSGSMNWSHSKSSGSSRGHTTSLGITDSSGGGGSVTEGVNKSTGGTDTTSVTSQGSFTEMHSHSNNYNIGGDLIAKVGYTRSNNGGENITHGLGITEADAFHHSTTQSHQEAETWQSSHGSSFQVGDTSQQSSSQGSSVGGSLSAGSGSSHVVTTQSSHTSGDSWSSSDTTSHSVTHGTADTTSHSVTDGKADSVQDSVAQSSSWGRGWADTHTEGETTGESWGEGRSEQVSQQASRSANWGVTDGRGSSVGSIVAAAEGLSAGIVPGVSVSRSWIKEDDVAIRLTEIARMLESLLNEAGAEGGFMTSALLFVGDRGARAAEALVPQAFHGPNVPTPVLTVPGDDSLREYALAFRPSLEPDGDPFQAGLWTKWGTLLTAGQLAAYTAPGIFEEGTALTEQEVIPPTAFYPDMKGEVFLGHQISPETGEITGVPVRLSRDRMFHFVFAADTGFGKSVAAERLVMETTREWHMKTIVLDFGAGWRKLLNAPGLQGRVEIRQLSPGGVRPLRWNPLQIGRNILPEVQWRAFCDIFGAIAQLGEKRQIHELRSTLRDVYLAAGVLVDDPEVRNDPTWGVVRQGEEAEAGAPAGTPLRQLSRAGRQRLAVLRSRNVGLEDLYARIEERMEGIPPRDILYSILDGIRSRLQPLTQGAAALQYAAGPDAIDINEIVPGDWGVAILEGGSFLDEFSKAFLLGWIAWHIYTDAVVRRLRGASDPSEYVQIVFEEANKILTGVGNEESKMASTAEQFEIMWRDSRKYGIWLHVITQSPSLIPSGILSSCNNMVFGNSKNPKDRDLIVASLHKSEKGLTDERWRRFITSLPASWAVGKFGYTMHREELEPVAFRPLKIPAIEPDDDEIAEKLGEIRL